MDYYNEFFHKSLAARVCGGDAGLETSAAQKTLHEELRAYVGTADGNTEVGIWMCCLALVVWTLTIVKELIAIHRSVVAVWAVPRCNESRLLANGGQRLRIGQLSCPRAAFFFASAAVRLAICLGLFYFGAQFLIVTVSVPELLLNACALEFILGTVLPQV